MSQFLYLCPAIVYELDEQHCVKDVSSMPHIHMDEDDHLDNIANKSKKGQFYLVVRSMQPIYCYFISKIGLEDVTW